MDLRSKLRAISSSENRKAAPESEETFLYKTRTDFPVSLPRRVFTGSALRRLGLHGESLDLDECLFIDTETTGLSGGTGTVAFLVSAGYTRGDVFTVEQFMMLDYPGEGELLRSLGELMKDRRTFVTYNGRTFDLPLIRNRTVMCRMRDAFPDEYRDLDLLYPVRACWKRRLGSCTLTHVEEELLRQYREGDIPGSEIPALYFRYLESKDLSLLSGVLEHNRLDTRSLLDILLLLLDTFAEPEKLTDRADLYSMGRLLVRRGERESAKKLYRMASSPPPRPIPCRGDPIEALALWQLYIDARKDGDTGEMRRLLARLTRMPSAGARPFVEMSKLYEHRLHDAREALRCAELAAQKGDAASVDDVERRVSRLRSKLERSRTGSTLRAALKDTNTHTNGETKQWEHS